MSAALDLFPEALPSHDPGGKSKPRWPVGSVVTARFGGPNDCYRYELHELWDAAKPAVTWLAMNPSTATIDNADPTLIRTGTFVRLWGFGAQFIANVHAYRATDSERLTEVDDPVGPENDAAILSMALRSEFVVLAYGQPKPKQLRARGPEVIRMLQSAGVRLKYLRLAKCGTPYHPLYLPSSLEPLDYAVKD